MGGEWYELGANEGGSLMRRRASPWSNAAGLTLTAGTICWSMRMAVARSV